MENDGTGIHPPIIRQESANWSVAEASEGGSRDDSVEQDVDVEENEIRPELSRATTGPPYTIFSPKAKMFIVLSVSVSGLISPFGAVTFYPALNVLARELNVTSSMINIALTTYMVCLSPPSRSIAMLNLRRLHKLLPPLSLPECRTPAVAGYRLSSASSSTSWPTLDLLYKRTTLPC